MYLGLVSPPHFVYDFSRKIFFMLYSINWPRFIVWLSLLFEMLGNMCILFVSQYDVINFEINLSSLNKLFFHMTKKIRTKILNTLRTKRALRWNKKHFISFLKRLLFAWNCVRPESETLDSLPGLWFYLSTVWLT